MDGEIFSVATNRVSRVATEMRLEHFRCHSNSQIPNPRCVMPTFLLIFFLCLITISLPSPVHLTFLLHVLTSFQLTQQPFSPRPCVLSFSFFVSLFYLLQYYPGLYYQFLFYILFLFILTPLYHSLNFIFLLFLFCFVLRIFRLFPLSFIYCYNIYFLSPCQRCQIVVLYIVSIIIFMSPPKLPYFHECR